VVARRFDAYTNEVSGDPVPVIDKVEYNVAGLGLVRLQL